MEREEIIRSLEKIQAEMWPLVKLNLERDGFLASAMFVLLPAVLVNEVWVGKPKGKRREDLGDYAASKDPDRQEAVAFLLVTYGWARSVYHVFTKNDDRILWGETETLDGEMENNLFPAFNVGVH